MIVQISKFTAHCVLAVMCLIATACFKLLGMDGSATAAALVFFFSIGGCVSGLMYGGASK